MGGGGGAGGGGRVSGAGRVNGIFRGVWTMRRRKERERWWGG